MFPRSRKTAKAKPAVAPRAHGAASRESGLRRLPQGDGPNRFRAGEFRRRRSVAHQDDGASIDPSGTLYNGAKVDGPVQLRDMIREPPGRVRRRDDREASDLRARPRRPVLRHARGAQDRARRRARTIFAFPRWCWGVAESVPFEMKIEDRRWRTADASRLRRIRDAVNHEKTSIPPDRSAGNGNRAVASLTGFDAARPDAAFAKTAANPQIKLGLCFIPHGAVMANWTPIGEGADFKISRTLAPD